MYENGRLRGVRVDGLGHVRQSVRRRAPASPPASHKEPMERRSALPKVPRSNTELQFDTMWNAGLPARRLASLDCLFCELRRRAAEEEA